MVPGIRDSVRHRTSLGLTVELARAWSRTIEVTEPEISARLIPEDVRLQSLQGINCSS